MLKSSEIDYVKYAVYCLRVFTCESNIELENGGNDDFMENIINSGIFRSLVEILKSYQDDSLIVIFKQI